MTELPDTPMQSGENKKILEVVQTEAHKIIDDISNRNTRNIEKLMVILSIGLVVELLLVFGVIVALTEDQNTGSQLRAVQQITSTQVLCPLYEALKSSESPQARAKSTNPTEYDNLVKLIQHGIDVLGCTHS